MTLGITTERLALRQWRASDAERFAAIYNDERVWRWLGSDPMPFGGQSTAETVGRIERWNGRCRDGLGMWAIVTSSDDVPLGTVLLLPLPGDENNPAGDNPYGDVEVGWHLAPDAWGHGYATEAAAAVIAHAWHLGIPTVHAVIYPGNEPSVAVAQRLGMHDRGLTDRWYGTSLRHFELHDAT